MSRFIAVECDDDVSRIHDTETGEWARIEFHGSDAFDVACGCAHRWNEMINAEAELMDEWLEVNMVRKQDGMFGDQPTKDDLDRFAAELDKLLSPDEEDDETEDET